MSPVDTILYYTKLLTALVIVLNFTSVASLYLLTLWLRYPEKAVEGTGVEGLSGEVAAGLPKSSGNPMVFRNHARWIMLGLLAVIVAINVLAVVANANLLQATDRIASLFSR